MVEVSFDANEHEPALPSTDLSIDVVYHELHWIAEPITCVWLIAYLQPVLLQLDTYRGAADRDLADSDANSGSSA